MTDEFNKSVTSWICCFLLPTVLSCYGKTRVMLLMVAYEQDDIVSPY